MTNNHKPAAGTRISYWLADVLGHERLRAGVSQRDMASALQVSERTIKRLETGHAMSRQIEEMVAGYAFVLGIEDGRVFWDRAIEKWFEHGAPTQFKPAAGPPMAFARAIRETALRKAQGPNVPSETPSSSPRTARARAAS